MLQRMAAVKLTDFVKNMDPPPLSNCPLKKRQGVDKWSRTMSGVLSDGPTQSIFFSPRSQIFMKVVVWSFGDDISLPLARGS